MSDAQRQAAFARVALPHLDAAYNLARWITGRDADAQDVVQEAYLRALRYFDGYRGGDARSWVLVIVRRTCFTWLARNRPSNVIELNAGVPSVEDEGTSDLDHVVTEDTPESLLISGADDALLNRMIAELPVAYREVVVLREIEDLSYREIAEIVGIPIGTVMSRLARARDRLQRAWHMRKARDEAGGM